MHTLTLIRAEKAQHLADAERLRLQVYRDEERMFPASARAETPSFGSGAQLDSNAQFLVYAGQEPVGTVRLHVARRSDAAGLAVGRGLELESKFRLLGFDHLGIVLAEVTGYCVLRRFRGTRVTPALFSALRGESLRRGVTHWVAAANMETDCAEDAAISYRLLRAQNLLGGEFEAHARSSDPAPTRAMRFNYTPEQRANARRDQLALLRLPRTLALFARKMGARYIGPPAYDGQFHVFAAPLVVSLADRSDVPLAGALSRPALGAKASALALPL